MIVPSAIVRDMELPKGWLLFLIVTGIFMTADAYAKKKEVLEIMVQLEQDMTRESEKLTIMLGRV